MTLHSMMDWSLKSMQELIGDVNSLMMLRKRRVEVRKRKQSVLAAERKDFNDE